ncbi:MAG TPA: 2-phospho-L-lactate guanylyltransferase [Candidatus Caldiarchaeum subterraneum]|uniref:2-phospho-L-lactate guanylyltransferase n=1 Tax=Caldiarchaeum subterraneum TaxID=311458 RepID=A0A832ZV33_CALS0|nr:2-phospho-L-lactate guanylyltransferase [Candidatus Caldarchaeum subterraneum]
MKTWAVIPLKRLDNAKTRLSTILTAEERRNLMLKLFSHVLETCVNGNLRCIVVAENPEIEKYTLKLDQHFILDSSGDLNEAVAKGLEYAEHKRFEGCLIVFADLPFLTVDDVNTIIRLLDFSNIVLCPDLSLEGTNIVGLRRGVDFFKPEFGDRSYLRFVESLHDFKTYLSLGTGLDLDKPEQFKDAKARGFIL